MREHTGCCFFIKIRSRQQVVVAIAVEICCDDLPGSLYGPENVDRCYRDGVVGIFDRQNFQRTENPRGEQVGQAVAVQVGETEQVVTVVAVFFQRAEQAGAVECRKPSTRRKHIARMSDKQVAVAVQIEVGEADLAC